MMYPGIYSAICVENDDPLKRGRIRLLVDGVPAVSGWALPCMQGVGLKDTGSVWVPDIGAGIWVMFQGGNFNYPVYMGGFFAEPTKTGQFAQEIGNEMPEEANEMPHRIRQIKTRSGHTIIFDDREGSEKIEIQDAAGQVIRMTCNMLAETKRNKAGKILKRNFEVTESDVDLAKIEVIDIYGNIITLGTDGMSFMDKEGNQYISGGSGILVEDKDGNTLEWIDSVLKLNGDTKNIVTHTELSVALGTFVTALNALFATKLNGGGTAGTLVLDISGSKATKIKTG